MTTVTEATAIVPAAAGAPVPGQQGPAPAPESSLTASPTTVSFVAQAALSQAASTPPPHGSPKSAAAADPQPVPISTDSTKPVPAPGTETTAIVPAAAGAPVSGQQGPIDTSSHSPQGSPKPTTKETKTPTKPLPALPPTSLAASMTKNLQGAAGFFPASSPTKGDLTLTREQTAATKQLLSITLGDITTERSSPSPAPETPPTSIMEIPPVAGSAPQTQDQTATTPKPVVQPPLVTPAPPPAVPESVPEDPSAGSTSQTQDQVEEIPSAGESKGGTEKKLVDQPPAIVIAPAPPPAVPQPEPEVPSAGSPSPDVVAEEESHQPPTPAASPKPSPKAAPLAGGEDEKPVDQPPVIVIEPAPAIAPAPPPVVLKLVPEDLSAGSTLPDVVAKEEPHRPPTPTASPKSLFEADKAPEPAPNPVVSTETAKTSNFAQNFFIILGTVGILTTLGGAGLLYFSSIIPTIVAGIPLLQAMGVAKIVAIAKVLPMIGGSMITLASISLLLTGMRASKKS